MLSFIYGPSWTNGEESHDAALPFEGCIAGATTARPRHVGRLPHFARLLTRRRRIQCSRPTSRLHTAEASHANKKSRRSPATCQCRTAAAGKKRTSSVAFRLEPWNPGTVPLPPSRATSFTVRCYFAWWIAWTKPSRERGWRVFRSTVATYTYELLNSVA
jgi:hypothetical protein